MKSLLNSKAEWSTYLPFWCWQWVSAGSNWARNASHGHHLTGTVTKGGGGPKQSPVNQCLAEFSRYPWLQSHPPIPRYPWIPPHIFRHPGFPVGPAGKESGCKAGVLGSIPGLGRSPGERKGYPLQYSWASLVVQLLKNHQQCGRSGTDPWVEKTPWRREQLPTPVFWPGEFHGLYSPQFCRVRHWVTFMSFQIKLKKKKIKLV